MKFQFCGIASVETYVRGVFQFKVCKISMQIAAPSTYDVFNKPIYTQSVWQCVHCAHYTSCIFEAYECVCV